MGNKRKSGAGSPSSSRPLLASMTPDERYYAHHFMAACDERVEFSVPREMRYRLRELGLMRWVGGRYFEVTDTLRDMNADLMGMYTDFGRDANSPISLKRKDGGR
jgi:hypothetical protein